jgi:hypothetical protein
MPERAKFIRPHLPGVASDPSPVRSLLGAERDLSFVSHAGPTSVLAKSRPLVEESRSMTAIISWLCCT